MPTKDEKAKKRRENRKRKEQLKKQKWSHRDISGWVLENPPLSTGQSQSGCYANGLSSCGGGLTREHYISESILAFFDELQVDNIPFLKGRCKALSISPSSLCSKVLCDKHNSFLSPLDSMAGELFGFMHRFGINDRKLMTVSGDSIEKWLCKVLMGYLSSGNVEHEGKKFSEKDIPQELISFVFLNQSLPVEWGLYSLYHIGQIIRNDEQKKFHMGPVFLNGRVMGLQVKMGFLDLMLALDKKDVVFRKDHPGYSMLIHKIRKIEYTRDSSTKYVEIKWKLLS